MKTFILISLGLFGLGALSLPVQAAPATPHAVIDTGEVEGVNLPAGAQAYLGIPYATPPVRDLRWREPQAPRKWSGVFHADRYAPQCVQPQRGILTNSYSGAEITSEDCLYLNIWTGASLRKAPVIVYIHGGAFFIGSSSMPLYGGEAVSREGAVFVNFNYRLGTLGFLAHPDLSKESPHGTSGNYALLDQVAALQWIKRNIARFGGDPDNVTIAGQSAGSMSVGLLQASPLARGLFHRAVGMSGSALEGPSVIPPKAAAEQEGLKLQTVLRAKSLAELRAMPADRLAPPRSADGPKIGPIVDGYLLTKPLDQIFARSEQNDVPLLLGFTHDESFGGLGPVSDLADYRAKAAAKFGDHASAFLTLYPASDDAQAREQARLADRDGTMVIGMDAWARMQAAHGRAPLFTYEFSRQPAFAPSLVLTDMNPATAGAYHTSEVPLWLGTLDSFNRFRHARDWTAADHAFSLAMTRSLVAFARTGNPSTRDMAWPAYDPSSRQLLELGKTAQIGRWPNRLKLDFFRSLIKAEPTAAAVRE
ncbi:carboxylesterase/lipase family protein [Sphingobium sp. YR768]|uniref:carboxylesterase/lipase family protein n=1 Tax=Sphingobium sp. YR768 TaxID=1884365 RepID=UPI0008B4D228|nr:carboxylesterase family protein [Sphingobium sp. YR768]SES11284.1 para-nitrobenzyl esterase [Sphingobium sp. YR768]